MSPSPNEQIQHKHQGSNGVGKKQSNVDFGHGQTFKMERWGIRQSVCAGKPVLVLASREQAHPVGGRANPSDSNFEAFSLKGCQEIRGSRLANVYRYATINALFGGISISHKSNCGGVKVRGKNLKIGHKCSKKDPVRIARAWDEV